MSKHFVPGIAVPGASRVMDPTAPVPAPLFDKKGRQVWDVPERFSRVVRHYKSAGARRLLKLGKLSFDEATVEVRIYRGMSARMFNKMRGEIKRAQRKGKS